MDSELIRRFIPLIILLLLSAYFSGSEAAFFSLSTLERDLLKRRGGSRLTPILAKLFSSPDEILITLLTGNMFVNVFASGLGEAIGARLFRFDSELFSIIAMTVLLLIVGEMVPKNLGVRHALPFSRFSARPLYHFFLLLTPLRWFLNLFNRITNFLFPFRNISDPTHSIIRSAVRIGFKEGILDSSELHLVESFCDFREKQAEEVMVPRMDIRGLEISTEIASVLSDDASIQPDGERSLLPAYDQDLDHIVGYIALRDLLPYKYGLKAGLRLAQLVKPSISVPSTKNCADLLAEMRESNTELAVVIDEYGGTAGIITFKALIAQLLGYFYPSPERELVEISPDTYRIAGGLRIDELSELMGERIDSESYTAAGLIIEKLGEIPVVDTRVVVGRLEFTVRKTSKNRILELEVRRLAP